jgi:N-acetylglucosaminyl-diphospho-decaprenol L-rhamnosyltransferase
VTPEAPIRGGAGARPPVAGSAPVTLPLSVCVVNFQGAAYLDQALAAIEALEAPVAEILVVDNASTDGSPESAARWPGVEVIRLTENRGPGVARNVGFARASNRLVLFLDHDVLPEPDCARALVEGLRSANATLAVPRIVFADNPMTVQYEGADAHFIGLMAFRNAGRAVTDCPDGIAEVQSLMTACFLLDRERWHRASLFDELFFYPFEDHDLALRARIAGHRIVSVAAARCRHGSGTPGLALRSGTGHTEARVVNLFRNRWIVVAKNYRLRTLIVLAPALAAFELFQFAGAIRKGWFASWLSALRWLLAHAGAIVRGRRAVQRTRVVGDGDILSGGPLPFSDRLLEGRIEAVAGRALDRFIGAWWRLTRRWV